MNTMTKEKFLTARWNNWLTLGLGLPTLTFGIFVLSTSILSDFGSFIGMLVIGALYWIVVEGHSDRQFAWQRKNSANPVPVKLRFTHPLKMLMIAYNVVYWIPIILPFTKIIDYRMGFITFFIVIVIRAAANLYRNNFLTLEQAEIFPFRI